MKKCIVIYCKYERHERYDVTIGKYENILGEKKKV
jgi:hypothetical protein